MQTETHDKLDLGFSDDQFREIPAAEGGVSVPAGKYIANISELELTQTKDRTKWMLRWTLEIVGGPFDGRKLFRNNLWDTPQQVGFLKRDLINCGIDVNDIGFKFNTFMNENLTDLLDTHIQVQVAKKTGNDGRENTNVYINGLADDGQTSDDLTSDAATDSVATAKPANPFL